ncbi:MAG: TIGR01777 family oxidoreductase [Brumimicrobium sp.]|nr:TIGR01777 family oxidoreductase [Brumimicrobium sp.]
MINKYTILVAGGTGLIGSTLIPELKRQGHTVNILTRDARGRKNHFNWSPKEGKIDSKALEKVDIIINLAGTGIADKRWTEKRRKEIIDSRVKTTEFLFEVSKEISDLKQYISASGINCYGYDSPERIHKEDDPFGTDFLSQVVEKWEASADLFQAKCKVTKVRTATVLSDKGGALKIIGKTIKYYIGAPLGKGNQNVPWISLTDIVNVYSHFVNRGIEGTYNALSGSITNKKLTVETAKVLNKPLWLPNVPAFVLKTVLGDMSSMVLKGLKADNSKLLATGFAFEHQKIEDALKDIYS